MTNESVAGPAAVRPESILADLKAQQNFPRAIPAGLIAALAGAALWGAVTYATQTSVGLIAIAVGALVGYAIRFAGRGLEPKFGFLGGACAALGWALGAGLSDVAFLAKRVDRPFLDVLAGLGADGVVSLAMRAFQPMDLLFLGIAVYEGYKFSFLYRLKTR